MTSRRRWAALGLAVLGALSCGRGLWIPVKAEIAQGLLERAWARTRAGEGEARPWSWADTWPVARLAAPRQGVEMIVLAGASGAVLAFGPGHLAGSAAPGETGNAVIAGHRDTHFEFLRRLEPGDEIRLETPGGARHRYRVEEARVVDERDVSVLRPADGSVLTLVTCYPFDAVVPGGPLRFVVRAVKA